MSNPRTTYILPLGEIVTPYIAKTLSAFIAILREKNSGKENSFYQAAITKIIREKQSIINAFKQGMLDGNNFSEDDFNKIMLAAIKETTSVELTVDEFNKAWLAMCPSYEEFAEKLDQVIMLNSQTNIEVVLISETNIKDMRKLQSELSVKSIEHKTDAHGNLTQIANIPVFLSYVLQKDKRDFVRDIVKEDRVPYSPRLHNREPQPGNYVYIYGVNNINEPTLRQQLDTSNAAIAADVERTSVQLVVWNKSQLLASVLAENAPRYRVEFARL